MSNNLIDTDVSELQFLLELFYEFRNEEAFFVQGRLVAIHQMAVMYNKHRYYNTLWKDESHLNYLLKELERKQIIESSFSAQFLREYHKISDKGVAFIEKGGYLHKNILNSGAA